MLESQYQSQLIKRLYRRFPGCVILKLDTDYMQGIPDLLILWMDKWATLEVKTHAGARTQPNQAYYVELMNVMSFSAFIYPSNEEHVLNELQLAFKPRGSSRLP
jgi:hypothetical protein